MMILVVNCGSSSLKYQLFDMRTETVLAKGLIERIGEAQGARCKHESAHGRVVEDVSAPDHETALHHMVERLTARGTGVVESVEAIEAVGHRVVHGGESFAQSAAITDAVIAAVEAQAPLAPLHNPPNLAGIRGARRVFPRAAHVAVFDTVFHQTMPPRAFLYPIPYEIYEQHRFRRYGFHGTSHKYVAERAAAFLGKPFDRFTGITCHLGNGCSLAAVKNGRSVDTSMGLTPLEGLMMGTRSGDVDPALPFFLHRQAGVPMEQIEGILNRRSGLLGISGMSNDMRPLHEAIAQGHARAKLAVEMFAYRVKKYIGAYLAVLNGADAIVFTGGIGERDPEVRALACADLDALGIVLDTALNATVIAREVVISAPSSRIKVLVEPTNEELEIARETLEIVRPAHAPGRSTA